MAALIAWGLVLFIFASWLFLGITMLMQPARAVETQRRQAAFIQRWLGYQFPGPSLDDPAWQRNFIRFLVRPLGCLVALVGAVGFVAAAAGLVQNFR
jgi:hypothetical protein